MLIQLSCDEEGGAFEAILIMNEKLEFWAKGNNLTQLESRLLRIARARGARLPSSLP